ncbi:MAG: hypothetical protein L3K16_09865 [Thermoplasmata archaeon]|nr:hypothetical protein [Thermoplasmata archaeon]
MPAVVGGGLGDIAEVLDAGRELAGAGFPSTLYRPADRPLPRSVDGPWDFRGIRRAPVLRPRAARALTVTPNWGVSAAPDRPGPLGRGGSWATEAETIEWAYGGAATLHVSLEEFARTLTSAEENAERWREGGETAAATVERRRTAEFRGDAAQFHRDFRTFRGFDRPNVLHVFQTFRPRSAFAREFPESIQVGPIWPARPLGRSPTERIESTEWVWYASPSSSDALVDEIDRGLRATGVRRIVVRSPRPLRLPSGSGVEWVPERPMEPAEWSRRFAAAGVRIVTGSRTLLEALAVGGPFLYFNGVLAGGRRRHRHRPEKVQALVRAWRAMGVPERIRRDVDDFSRGRRVAEVVRTAATDRDWSRRFPRSSPVGGFPAHRRDGGAYLVDVARAFATGSDSAPDLVRRLRAEGRGSGRR